MKELIISGAVVSLVILAAISIIFHTMYNRISPIPTSSRIRKLMLEGCKGMQIRGSIIELGSGWGSLAFPLASACPQTRVIGYENSPVPYLFSRLRLVIQRRPNLRIRYKNFYNVSLKEAGLIVCYLYPKGMEKLRKKFDKELEPGACVISNTFAVPGWEPEKTVEADDLYKSKVYFYAFQRRGGS